MCTKRLEDAAIGGGLEDQVDGFDVVYAGDGVVVFVPLWVEYYRESDVWRVGWVAKQLTDYLLCHIHHGRVEELDLSLY